MGGSTCNGSNPGCNHRHSRRNSGASTLFAPPSSQNCQRQSSLPQIRLFQGSWRWRHYSCYTGSNASSNRSSDAGFGTGSTDAPWTKSAFVNEECCKCRHVEPDRENMPWYYDILTWHTVRSEIAFLSFKRRVCFLNLLRPSKVWWDSSGKDWAAGSTLKGICTWSALQERCFMYFHVDLEFSVFPGRSLPDCGSSAYGRGKCNDWYWRYSWRHHLGGDWTSTVRGAVFTFFNRVVVLFQSGEENWGGWYQRLFNSFAHMRSNDTSSPFVSLLF